MFEHLDQLYGRLTEKRDWNDARDFEDLTNYRFPANLDATQPLSISDFGNLDPRFLHRLGVARSRMLDIRVQSVSLRDRLDKYREYIDAVQKDKMHQNIYYQREQKLLNEGSYGPWEDDLKNTVAKHKMELVLKCFPKRKEGDFGDRLRKLEKTKNDSR